MRLLHLWVKACVGLTMPLHLDTSLKEVPISLTYTPDIAQAPDTARICKGIFHAFSTVHVEAKDSIMKSVRTWRNSWIIPDQAFLEF